MIFGVDINTAYAIVLGATAFCLVLTGVAWVVHQFREWKIWRSKGDSNTNKS